MTQRKIDSLRHGAQVYTSDGKEVGRLWAIIIDPDKGEVTHLGVDTGPGFPSIGFGDPRVVSVDIKRLRDADNERADLDATDAEFHEMPLYQHEHFFRVPDDEQPPMIPDAEPPAKLTGPERLWNAGLAIAASLASLGSGLAVPAEHFAKAKFERHILNDTPVWRGDSHIGDIEEVIIDEDTDAISGFVVGRGAFFGEERVLPLRYVTEIRDGVVRAELTDDELDNLARHTRE